MNSLIWKFLCGIALVTTSALSQAVTISNSNPLIIEFSSALFTSSEPTAVRNGSYSAIAHLEGDLFDSNEAVTILYYENDLTHDVFSLPMEGQWQGDRTVLSIGGCCLDDMWNDAQGFIVFRPAIGTMNVVGDIEFSLVKNSIAYTRTFSIDTPLPGTFILFSSAIAGFWLRKMKKGFWRQ